MRTKNNNTTNTLRAVVNGSCVCGIHIKSKSAKYRVCWCRAHAVACFMPLITLEIYKFSYWQRCAIKGKGSSPRRRALWCRLIIREVKVDTLHKWARDRVARERKNGKKKEVDARALAFHKFYNVSLDAALVIAVNRCLLKTHPSKE